MEDMLAQLQAYGLRMEVADLGDWSPHELRAEYDGGTIRVNARWLARVPATQRAAQLRLALAHEFYHHLEAIGEVARKTTGPRREEAADAWARRSFQ